MFRQKTLLTFDQLKAAFQPLVENIEVRCWDKSIKHTPPEIPLAPARTPNPYGDPLP